MNNPQRNTSGKIHPLTSLRFFAALYVVLYHTLGNLIVGKFIPGNIDIPVPSRALPNFGSRALSIGFISVSFFFLLSGYILAVVYLRRSTRVDRRKFFLARFARIYPLFLITLILDTPFAYYGMMRSSSVAHGLLKVTLAFGVGAAMLQAWIVQLRGINNPNWSLSVEALFYLSFPFLGAFLWRLRGKQRWLAALLIYAGGQLLVWVVTPHVTIAVAIFNPLLHLSTFALGILLAGWQFDEHRPAQTKVIQPWKSYVVLALSTVAFAAAVQICGSVPLTSLKDGILAPIFIGVIWGVSSSDNAISRLLSASWLVILGEASFGLYLLHIPVLHIFEFFHSVENPAFYAGYLALTILLSVLSFYYVETPLRIWILERFHSRASETMESASLAQ